MFCAVWARVRRLRKSPQYLLVISQWKITVSTILRKTPQTNVQKHVKIAAASQSTVPSPPLEDRVQRRKEEIESLQEALRILNGEDRGRTERPRPQKSDLINLIGLIKCNNLLNTHKTVLIHCYVYVIYLMLTARTSRRERERAAPTQHRWGRREPAQVRPTSPRSRKKEGDSSSARDCVVCSLNVSHAGVSDLPALSP